MRPCPCLRGRSSQAERVAGRCTPEEARTVANATRLGLLCFVESFSSVVADTDCIESYTIPRVHKDSTLPQRVVPTVVFNPLMRTTDSDIKRFIRPATERLVLRAVARGPTRARHHYADEGKAFRQMGPDNFRARGSIQGGASGVA